MNTNLNSQETKQQLQAATSVNPAADVPPPAGTTPEQLVDQLRAVRQQFGDLTVLTVQ